MQQILKAAPESFATSPDPRGADAKPVNIEKLAFQLHEEGQLYPVIASEVEGTLTVHDGRRRKLAAQMLRTGFEWGGKKIKDPDFTLSYILASEVTSPEVAFGIALSGNDRENLTDAQEAAAHQYGRDTFGWDDAEIRRLFGYTNNNRVAALKTFAAADKSIRSLLGKFLSLDACVTLAKAKVSEKKMEALIAGVKDGTYATTRQLLDAIGTPAEPKAAKGTKETEGGEGEDDEPAEAPVIRARNVSHLEKLVEEEEFPEGGVLILKAAIEWLRGKAQTPRGLRNAMEKAGMKAEKV